jgi:predicted SnoaL-like aldol condensation-catalyzing enzyme
MKLLLAALLSIACIACEQKHGQPASSVAEKNKEMLKRACSEIVAGQNYSLIDSFFSTNIFDHNAFEGQQQGLAGFKRAVSEFLGTFSHIEIAIEAIIAEGDLVSTREAWKVIRASDKKELTGQTMHWFLIKDGKITDEWSKGWEWAEG